MTPSIMMKAVWIIFLLSSISFASSQHDASQTGSSTESSVSLLPTAVYSESSDRFLQQYNDIETGRVMSDELICHVVIYELMLQTETQHSRLYSCRPIHPGTNDADPVVEYRLENVPTHVRDLIESQLGHTTVVSIPNVYMDTTEMIIISADWLSVRLLPDVADTIRYRRRHRQNNRVRNLRQQSNTTSHARMLTSAQGELSVLPILITTRDGKSPDYTPNSLFNLLFVGDGSVKRQFSECSFGKLSLEPTPLQVLSVRIDERMSDARGSSSILVRGATEAALRQVRDYVRGAYTVNYLDDFADLTMFVTPEMPNWVAYAQVFGTMSVYNNDWGESLGVVMHEMGHNFGLGHANERGAYQDYSSYMGGAIQGHHTRPRSPLMSFNAYHHVQLGWFDSRHIRSVDVTNSFSPSTLIRMVAFPDYDISVANGSEFVIAKVGNFYLQYNRAKKFNAGVIEYADYVVIVENMAGTAETELVGALEMNGSNRVFRRGSLHIELCSEHRSNYINEPDYVLVGISGRTGSSLCTAIDIPDKKAANLDEEPKDDGSKLSDIGPNQENERGGIRRRRKRALKGTSKIVETSAEV